MRFTFVGDIALGDHPKAVGFGFRSRYASGIPESFAGRLRPPGRAPDLFFGNLEFALGLREGERDFRALECRGLDDYVSFLAAEGIGALNVATNHTVQHGQEAFDATVKLLRASGIHVVGTPSDFTEQGILRVGDQRVALLGWCDRPRQYHAEPPPFNEFSDDAYARIAEARTRADLVLVSMHWGDEFILVPSAREREVARRMVDAGATFVVGHHPHVMREVEEYAGGLIAYSLGNFVCDMTWDFRTRLSGWLNADVEGRRVTHSEMVPAVIDDDYLPRPLDRRDDRRFESVVRERRSQSERVDTKGDLTLAEWERRRHAARTAVRMLQSWNRYPPGMALELFRKALGRRLTSVLGVKDE
jgi:hypothetical protein